MQFREQGRQVTGKTDLKWRDSRNTLTEEKSWMQSHGTEEESLQQRLASGELGV